MTAVFQEYLRLLWGGWIREHEWQPGHQGGDWGRDCGERTKLEGRAVERGEGMLESYLEVER